MSAATSRRRRAGMPATERAKLLAKFDAQIAARRAADPVDAEKVLFRMAAPEPLRSFWNWPRPLYELYTWQRRACVLRAWCARRIARHESWWRKTMRAELASARRYHDLARADREERAGRTR